MRQLAPEDTWASCGQKRRSARGHAGWIQII